MKMIFFLSFFLLCNYSNGASLSSRSCTKEHLVEAIELNERRKPWYAHLSNDRSLPVSEALLSMERDLLKKAFFADLVVTPFHRAGIPLLCDEYVSMELTPLFQPLAKGNWPVLAEFRSLDIPIFIQKIEAANKQRNFAKVLNLSKQALEIVNEQPQFHCLLRHFLESIARTAFLAPKQNALSKKKLGISSQFISSHFIKIHLDLLSDAKTIDLMAAPLQAEGLPIVCQDVPPIPIEP